MEAATEVGFYSNVAVIQPPRVTRVVGTKCAYGPKIGPCDMRRTDSRTDRIFWVQKPSHAFCGPIVSGVQARKQKP